MDWRQGPGRPEGATAKLLENSIDGQRRAWRSLRSCYGVDVTVEGDFELAKRLCLNLTCVLQFPNPVSLLLFKAGNLSLNLNSLLVFFVDAPDEVKTLLLLLEGELLVSQFLLLLLLTADHMFHRLSLKLV